MKVLKCINYFIDKEIRKNLLNGIEEQITGKSFTENHIQLSLLLISKLYDIIPKICLTYSQNKQILGKLIQIYQKLVFNPEINMTVLNPILDRFFGLFDFVIREFGKLLNQNKEMEGVVVSGIIVQTILQEHNITFDINLLFILNGIFKVYIYIYIMYLERYKTSK